MAMDSQLAHKFLQIVANVDDVGEQFRAIPSVVDVGAVVRLSATAGEDIPWQWRDNDAAGGFVPDEKCRGVIEDFSKHLQMAHNNVSSQVVFPGRVERHRE
jgi:hypothetical protein